MDYRSVSSRAIAAPTTSSRKTARKTSRKTARKRFGAPTRRERVANLVRYTVAATTITVATAAAGSTPDIEARLKVLEDEIAALRKAAAEQPKVKADNKGFYIAAADGGFNLNVAGFAQVDARTYDGDDTVSNDEFVVRRIRPTVRGQLTDRIGFRFTAEFADTAGTLLDGYTDLSLARTHLLRVGRFKGPVGLERLQSVSNTAFVERAFPTELVPQRDLGAQLQGAFAGGALSYMLGVYNGGVDGRIAATRNVDDEFETGARVFFEPWISQPDSWLKGLGFGIGASHGKKQGTGNDVLPRYRAPAQETIFSYRATVSADGDHTRVSPQGYYYKGPFGVLAEYVNNELEVFDSVSGDVDTIQNTAWQVSTTFVVTGEAAGYAGVSPRSEFTLNGSGIGAIELALRLSELEIDDGAFPVFANPATAVESARSVGVGVNWYLTRNAKAVFNVQRTQFDGGAAAGDRDDETLVVARLQYNI